uniref:ETS domain-containing protein n=1 Tax=Caenorhabditis tropicalis TaxID=1561998 RepID=A0A1I7UIP7_9PELO
MASQAPAISEADPSPAPVVLPDDLAPIDQSPAPNTSPGSSASSPDAPSEEAPVDPLPASPAIQPVLPDDPAIQPDLLAPLFGPIRPKKSRTIIRHRPLLFVKALLDGGENSDVITWTKQEDLTFQFRDQKKFASMYGQHTGNPGTKFDSIMRNFRLYRAKGLVEKIPGIQSCWRILDRSIFEPKEEVKEEEEDPEINEMVQFLAQPNMIEQMADLMKQFDRFHEMIPIAAGFPIEQQMYFFEEARKINPDIFRV